MNTGRWKDVESGVVRMQGQGMRLEKKRENISDKGIAYGRLTRFL